jgi:SNF2 family DNA or RNA helicase
MTAMVKRLFPASKTRNSGTATFPFSKRLIGDLSWFMQRYPLKIKCQKKWNEVMEEAHQHYIKMQNWQKKPTKAQPTARFVGELKEFQKIGLSFMLENTRTLLADEMGLGKTVVTLAWLDKLPVEPPYIVVVPPHLRLQWRREINKFLGTDNVHMIKGLKPYPLPKADFYIIHYLLLRGWKTALRDYDFSACVFDEIQELRRSESEKYSAASILSTDVPHLAGLSGTPFYNYGGEMWNILNIVEFKCLGDYGSFSREWCWKYMGTQIEDPKLFGNFLRGEGLFLRRTKEEVMDELPPKYRVVQSIDVDNEKYDELIQPVIKMACEIPELKEAFKRGQQTRYAIDQTRRVTGLAKARHVASFTKTLLEAEQPTVLYAHHHDVIDILMVELRKYNPVMISGRQNTNQKDLSQELFMKGDTDLIIVSLRSGLGLNLQRGKCVVFGELDWSPAVHTQCEDRCHRIGVKDMVLCYYLICEEGTDQAIRDTLGVKTSQFVEIMGDRKETEDDKLTAQQEIRKHMGQVIDKLQEQGGTKKPEPSTEIKEKIEYLQKTTKKRSEPRSLDDFADGSKFDENMFNEDPEDLL